MDGKTVTDKHTIGIVYGRFIPFGSHDEAAVVRSMAENGETFIGISGKDTDGGMAFLPFLRRVRILRDIYRSRPNVRISEIDEACLAQELPGDPVGDWKAWGEHLFQNAVRSPDRTDLYGYTWYCRDEAQADTIRQAFPGHKTVVLDVQGPDEPHPWFRRAMDLNGRAS